MPDARLSAPHAQEMAAAPPSCVALVGTLDTKGEEFAFLRQCVESIGLRTIVVDTGVLGEPPLAADICAGDVARAAGSDLDELRRGEKAAALQAMSAGSAQILRALYDEGTIQGAMSMGGGQGTLIGSTALRALPLGFPKLMLSTVAGIGPGLSPVVEGCDVTVMNSVVDISGLNGLSRSVISSAASALAGMVGAL